jgi:hypothetical protein
MSIGQVVTPGVPTRFHLPHGDHEHFFSFGPEGPLPILRLKCGHCDRVIRDLTLDHSGVAHPTRGSISPQGRSGEQLPGSGTVSQIDPITGKQLHRRAAECFDASPWGWSPSAGREPTHYRFVCRHRSAALPTLARRVSTDELLARYLDAVCAGSSTVTLD